MRLFALHNFIARFVDMHHDGKIRFLGDGQDTAKGVIADRIRRMRGQHQLQAPVTRNFIARGEAARDIGFSVGRVGCWKLDNRAANGCAHPGFARGPCRDIVIKVHVGETGGAASDHFSASEFGAIENERFGQVLGFDRPNVIFQPRHQRRVVGEPAHQRHRGMRVQINEAGNQHMRIEPRFAHVGELLARDRRRQDRDDAGTRQHDGVVFQYCRGRFNRDHPARGNELRCLCHGELFHTHKQKSPAACGAFSIVCRVTSVGRP